MGAHFPAPLRAGSTIAVIAPASPFPRVELLRGLAWLAMRYRVRMFSDAFARTGYLAGDDERRSRELAWALAAPGLDAVFAARGGYGITRVLEHVDIASAVHASPRWVVGFSDVTALHVSITNAGLASVHAPNVTGLGLASVAMRASLLRALERPHSPVRWEGLSVLRAGRARGPVFGGNVALLEAMAAAGRLHVPEGALLLLEDVTERPYRIDRMLTSLALGGHLARASAIVLGEFAQCDPGPDGVTVDDVLAARATSLGVPVVAGAPFGHGVRNEAFIVGQTATLDGNVVTFGG